MKVITESKLRQLLKEEDITTFYLPEGSLLSPSAKDFLSQKKIPWVQSKEQPEELSSTKISVEKNVSSDISTKDTDKFMVDYETGLLYKEKPEYTTHIHGNILVAKNHPRIVFRGKLDSLQGQVVLLQANLSEKKGSSEIVRDLEDLMQALTSIMKSDVLNTPLEPIVLMGLTLDEIHERSHNPMKWYKIKQLLLPHYSMGVTYAQLNLLRADIRQIEVLAVDAFYHKGEHTRIDIVNLLNRLSSFVHLLGCKFLAGEYNE